MEMKTYHCDNPTEIHLANQRYFKNTKAEEKPEDLVQKFKKDPNSFFAPIVPPGRPLG